MKKLEVEDKIYCYHWDNGIAKIHRRHTITRVSDKFAFSKISDSYEIKFKREFDEDGTVTESPKDLFKKDWYVAGTPEQEVDFRKAIYISKINKALNDIATMEKYPMTTQSALEYLAEIEALKNRMLERLILESDK